MHKNHKRDFSYLNLHTEFSVEGDDNIPFFTRACFNECVRRHRVFGERVLKKNDITSNKYTVSVVFSNPVQHYGNCCLLSEVELAEWIEDMKRFAEFEFKFRPDDRLPEGEAILVDIKFNERPFAEHFLVLEMIKHSYEHLFNFSVYQAVKLRKIINPDELLINLHNLIFCCNVDFNDYSCSDHTIATSLYYAFKDCNTFGNKCVVSMRTADEIKKMLPETQMLSTMFDPAYVCGELQSPKLRSTLRMVHYKDEFVNTECQDKRVKACIEQLSKFKYFLNKKHGCSVRNFDSYFNPALCKKRLDAYLETYERIRIDG